MGQAIDELREALGEISDLGRARALLAWDERTKMPTGGGAARAEQVATLARLRHQRLAADELGRVLERAEAGIDDADPQSVDAGLVRITRREWEKARRVPAELRAELARATSLGEQTWQRARAESDFALLAPRLEQVIELRRRYVECFEFAHPYDPLLDDYEPDMRTVELRPLLGALAAGTRELLDRIRSSPVELDASVLRGDFDLAAQRELAADVAALLPLSRDSYRLDTTTHPFAAAIAITDLRVTTRYDPGYVGTAVWSVAHEMGHAMYHNGCAPELGRTLLAGSISLGFDESQSRLWENWVGRSRPFMDRLLPLLARHLGGGFGELEAAALYRAANRVEPSLIRVEADEVTYNLHIAMRFELELALFEGELEPADLPEAWREKTREHLGLEVPDDARGVLQDVHWASGSFGYFPTYALGNLIAAEIWAGARAALPDLDRQIAAGELMPLRDHLGELLYRHGARELPAQAVRRLTGGPLRPEPLLSHLRAKYGALYELDGG